VRCVAEFSSRRDSSSSRVSRRVAEQVLRWPGSVSEALAGSPDRRVQAWRAWCAEADLSSPAGRAGCRVVSRQISSTRSFPAVFQVWVSRQPSVHILRVGEDEGMQNFLSLPYLPTLMRAAASSKRVRVHGQVLGILRPDPDAVARAEWELCHCTRGVQSGPSDGKLPGKIRVREGKEPQYRLSVAIELSLMQRCAFYPTPGRTG